MNYLQDQAVRNFAGTAARGSAIGTAIQQGMVSYLNDTNAIEVYRTSGTAVGWDRIDAPASPNILINGDFAINQRNYSSGTVFAFVADRWFTAPASGTVTVSRQSLAPATIPGIDSDTHVRIVTTGQTAANSEADIIQRVEDVRTLAGRMVTISFWAKAASGTPNVAYTLSQNFGTGGSATVHTGGKLTLTGGSSWTRYSVSVLNPSISGKTIGSANYLQLTLWASAGSDYNARTDSLGIQSNTFDFASIQLEAGLSATPFRRNANSIQGELAACMRYFYQIDGGTADGGLVQGVFYTTTEIWCTVIHPVPMRVSPTFSVFAGSPPALSIYAGGGGNRGYVSASTYGTSTTQTKSIIVRFTVSSGVTAGIGGWAGGNNAWVRFDSEI
jgi:hypothetical protein